MIFIEKKNLIKKSDFFNLFKIWYIDIYIDVYIYKLFQPCSIQIDLGICLNRGYIIFAYIKTLGNVHKASPPSCSCIICLGKESMLCVCGCSSANYCLLRGCISTCLGLCVLYGSPTANWYSIKQLSPRLSHLSQHTELVTTSTISKWTLTQGF